jgi:hypothetical protein
MPVDEPSRHRLYQKLDELLGSEEATTLMALLPASEFDWSELATKDDLFAAKQDLRGDFGSHRREVEAEMQALRHELRGEMESLRHELRGEMQALGHELRGEMERMMRRVITWTSSLVVAGMGLVVAAVRFV